jgi:DNA-binding transcriptional LysR family regulator
MLKKDARLRALHAVVTHGSFTKAAEALSLSQQAVSFQIKSLEDELGTRLLQRHGKNIELTETGDILFRHAKKILDLYSAAEDAIAQKTGSAGGLLNIGATGSIAKYCLPAAIGEFRKKHGNVSVAVSVGNSERIADLLAQEVIDLGIISGGPVELDRFHVAPFFDDELVFIAAAQHPLAARKAISIVELATTPFVMRERGSGTKDLVDGYFRDRGIDSAELPIAAILGSTEAVKAAVAAAAGIAMVSRLSLSGEAIGETFAILDVDADRLQRSFYIVRLRDSYMRLVLDQFVRTLRAQNAERIMPAKS